MSQYILLLLVVLLFPLYRLFRRESSSTQYLLSKEQNQILALAHPLAQARIEGGFADQPLPQFSEKLLKSLRVPVLHSFGFKTDMTDQQIKNQLSIFLLNKWFTVGLEKLSANDQPKLRLHLPAREFAF